MHIYLFHFLLLYQIIICVNITNESSFYYNNFSKNLEFHNISCSNCIYIQIFLCNETSKTNFTLKTDDKNIFNGTISNDSNQFIYNLSNTNNINVTLNILESIPFFIRYKCNVTEKINLSLIDEVYSEESLIFKINISSNYFNKNISYKLYYFNNKFRDVCEMINQASNIIPLNSTYKIINNLHEVTFENKFNKSNETYFFIKAYDEENNFTYFLYPEKLSKINQNIFFIIIFCTWFFIFLFNCIILKKKFIPQTITNDEGSDSFNSSYSSYS